MAKFRVCEYCGDHLDYGERCDCRDNLSREGLVELRREVAVDGTEKFISHQGAMCNYPQARIKCPVLGGC